MRKYPELSIRLIAAMGRSGQIGRGNALLWKHPEDMAQFRMNTEGHVVVMGRKTWESIGSKPLKNRFNIVLTSKPRSADGDTAFCDDLDKAFRLAIRLRAPDVWVIGGAAVYEAALPHAREMLLTEMDDDPPADAFFPRFDREEWRLGRKVEMEGTPKATLGFWAHKSIFRT